MFFSCQVLSVGTGSVPHSPPCLLAISIAAWPTGHARTQKHLPVTFRSILVPFPTSPHISDTESRLMLPTALLSASSSWHRPNAEPVALCVSGVQKQRYKAGRNPPRMKAFAGQSGKKKKPKWCDPCVWAGARLLEMTPVDGFPLLHEVSPGPRGSSGLATGAFSCHCPGSAQDEF